MDEESYDSISLWLNAAYSTAMTQTDTQIDEWVEKVAAKLLEYGLPVAVLHADIEAELRRSIAPENILALASSLLVQRVTKRAAELGTEGISNELCR